MTTTVPQQQVDDLRIVTTPPTIDDANLIMQIATYMATTGADQGFAVLAEFESPPTLTQLRRKHPRDSEAYRQVQALIASSEITGTFVKNGVLNEALAFDTFWVQGAWRSTEKVCKALRKEAGEPRLYENFEWLASRAS